MAENGSGSKRLGDLLARSREEFIREGVAAGFSRKQMEARANEFQLTPKLVRTVLEVAGEKQFERAANNARSAMKRLNGLTATGRAVLKDLASGYLEGVIDDRARRVVASKRAAEAQWASTRRRNR